MADYAVAAIEDIEELNDGRIPWRPLAAHLGIGSFGTNVWRAAQAGDRVINEHLEEDEGADEELYVVLSGRAAFELGDERHEAPAGTCVRVAPGVRRTAIAQEPDTTVLVVGAIPGRAYVPKPWSVWGPLEPLYAAGRYAELADRAPALLAAYPRHPGIFYNIACCESMAGRPDDALGHLARAFALSGVYRQFALEDTDLDPLRGDPRFAALMEAQNGLEADSASARE